MSSKDVTPPTKPFELPDQPSLHRALEVHANLLNLLRQLRSRMRGDVVEGQQGYPGDRSTERATACPDGDMPSGSE